MQSYLEYIATHQKDAFYLILLYTPLDRIGVLYFTNKKVKACIDQRAFGNKNFLVKAFPNTPVTELFNPAVGEKNIQIMIKYAIERQEACMIKIRQWIDEHYKDDPRFEALVIAEHRLKEVSKVTIQNLCDLLSLYHSREQYLGPLYGQTPLSSGVPRVLKTVHQPLVQPSTVTSLLWEVFREVGLLAPLEVIKDLGLLPEGMAPTFSFLTTVFLLLVLVKFLIQMVQLMSSTVEQGFVAHRALSVRTVMRAPVEVTPDDFRSQMIASLNEEKRKSILQKNTFFAAPNLFGFQHQQNQWWLHSYRLNAAATAIPTPRRSVALKQPSEFFKPQNTPLEDLTRPDPYHPWAVAKIYND